MVLELIKKVLRRNMPFRKYYLIIKIKKINILKNNKI